MSYRRGIIGLLSIGTLLLAAYVLVVQGDTTSFFANVCLRLGIVFVAMFVAWPTLESMGHRLPVIVNGTLLVIVAGLVIRPNLARLLLILAVIVLAVHFGIRFWVRYSQRES